MRYVDEVFAAVACRAVRAWRQVFEMGLVTYCAFEADWFHLFFFFFFFIDFKFLREF